MFPLNFQLEKEFDMMYPDKGPLFLKSFPDLIHALSSNEELVEINGFESGETSGKLLVVNFGHTSC